MNRTNSRIAIITIILCTCILSVVLVACNASSSGGDAGGESEQAQDTSEPGTAPYDQHAPVAPSGKTDVAKLQTKKARSFITVYVATHVRNTGEEGAPMEMTQEDWVSNCMSYVDPESELGKAFAENPESLRSPYGTHDQRVVNATKASRSGEKGAVLITATVESTMNDWGKASTHKEMYLVRFSDSSLITAVEPRGMQPAE